MSCRADLGTCSSGTGTEDESGHMNDEVETSQWIDGGEGADEWLQAGEATGDRVLTEKRTTLALVAVRLQRRLSGTRKSNAKELSVCRDEAFFACLEKLFRDSRADLPLTLCSTKLGQKSSSRDSGAASSKNWLSARLFQGCRACIALNCFHASMSPAKRRAAFPRRHAICSPPSTAAATWLCY